MPDLLTNQALVARPEFIDVFAGAGGLSLGLLQAGWNGLFAVEKSPMAFETLEHNLINVENGPSFSWPNWIPKAPIDIIDLLQKYPDQLRALKGITLLAGGPPCQGFSMSGKRKHNDERNFLFKRYLDLVDLLRPQMLLVENVNGFAKAFRKTERGLSGAEIEDNLFNANDEIQQQMIEKGYKPFVKVGLLAKDFGVPQWRPRYIVIAIRDDLLNGYLDLDPFAILYRDRETFLSELGLPIDREVTAYEAISDLEMQHGFVPCIEPRMSKFRQGVFGSSEGPYQELMRVTRTGKPIEQGVVADSHRFPNHSEAILERFKRILAECRPGVQLANADRERLAISKHRIALLASDQACHTLTSIPDDLVHYSEPRIPTVREYARIQSFPDWFQFRSKYTTGGDHRRVDVPRYTQAANAVPPLLATAIGRTLLKIFLALHQGQESIGSTNPQEILAA